MIYGTARQNIIDGFSQKEWLMSKIGLAKILALFSTILVVSIGFGLGFGQGVEVQMSDVFKRFDFVLAYYIELAVYFVYAIFIALVLRRTGIAVILLLVYDVVLEPILSWSLPDRLGDLLPMSVIDNLNSFPFSKYVGNESIESVSLEQFIWAIGYGACFSVLSYLLLNKKDL